MRSLRVRLLVWLCLALCTLWGGVAAWMFAGMRHELRSVLDDEPQISAQLSAQELDRLLDPANYLGQAVTWVERARAEHFALTP